MSFVVIFMPFVVILKEQAMILWHKDKNMLTLLKLGMII